MSTSTSDSVINNILYITNTLCQVIIAIAAIVAIIVTIKQIKSKKKSNLKVSYSFGLSMVADKNGVHKIIEGLNIKIRNVGIAPAYYDDCGIMFVNNKKFLSKKHYPGIFIAQLDEEHKPFDLTSSYALVFDIPSTFAISCTDNINGSSS